ncbi:MAG TPA: tRNA-dihydrouridine synthase [Myxococcaceae bacterium]|nr:tRNA-dihydrouridine synthase [Myxococcaceae bacterium]
MVAVESPLKFRNLEIKNRVIRAGSSPAAACFGWELRFAEAGVGAIISPRAAVRPMGLPTELPAVHPSWREHVGRVHAYGCPYIIRIGQGNSMQEAPDGPALKGIVRGFAEAARAVRDCGADGVEIDGARGSLIAQLLGPGMDDRSDRARFAREVVEAVRRAVGTRFHVQVRLGASSPLGMMAAGTLKLVRELEEEGVDAIHLIPDGDHPGAQAEGPVAFATRCVKEIASVPILRNGLFRSPEGIVAALENGSCDAVTLTRPLVRRPAVTDLGTRRAA